MMRPGVVEKVEGAISGQIWRSLAYWKGHWDTVVAIFILFVAQFLIVGMQVFLGAIKCPFPAQILAMLLVFLLFYITGRLHLGVEGIYTRHLKAPAAILNKHMSIGFVIPFLVVCRNPPASSETVGLITACFLLTGLMNIMSSYGIAFPLQMMLVRLFCRIQKHRDRDLEDGLSGSTLFQGGQGNAVLVPHELKTTSTSEVSSLANSQGLMFDARSEVPPCPTTSGSGHKQPSNLTAHHDSHHGTQDETRRNDDTATEGAGVPGINDAPVPTTNSKTVAAGNAQLSPVLCLCWFLTFAVGIPARTLANISVPLDTFLLFSLWLTTVAMQNVLRSPGSWSIARHPRLGVFLVGCLNIVLCTTLAMMAYVYAMAAATNQPVQTVLDGIQTNVTFADMVFHNTPAYRAGLLQVRDSAAPTTLMGAGDIALAILNGGLVSWGLKLYECHRQLLSRAGVTVFTVSSIAAITNVVCGPLLVEAVGLPNYNSAAEALAFAARSVTLALGTPALTMLGGDHGLNAALVIVNGIIFQMGLGFGVDKWLGQQRRRLLGDCGTKRRSKGTMATITSAPVSTTESSEHVGSDAQPNGEKPIHVANGGTETGDVPASSNVSRSKPPAPVGGSISDVDYFINDPATVAAGITVGINSAALGTAHLYEAGSFAAPYSALSMIVYGVMTVVFCSIKPLANWLVAAVSQ